MAKPRTAKRAAEPKTRRKPDDTRKEAQLRLRLTDEQKTQFTAAAAREGLDLSAWLRWLATREVRRYEQEHGGAK